MFGRYLVRAAWINALIVVLALVMLGIFAPASKGSVDDYIPFLLILSGMLNFAAGVIVLIFAFDLKAARQSGLAMMVVGLTLFLTGGIWLLTLYQNYSVACSQENYSALQRSS